MDREELRSILAENRIQESRNHIKEQKILSENTIYKREVDDFYDKLYSNEDTYHNYNKFKSYVTEAYLVEGLTILVDNCVSPALIREPYNQKLVRQLVSNFVKQEGASNLLNRFNRTSYLLSEMAYICNKHIESVLEKADKTNKETFKLDKNNKTKFYDDLSKIDVDRTIDKITANIKQETQDFINNNISNQNKIKSTLEKTKEKIQSVKGKNKDQIQEGYMEIGKRKITDLRESRTKNIFECMVYNLSRSALINESANKVFVENSQLNMDKIVEHCEVLYTFLTTLDTCKIINVDESYIETLLKDMIK